MKSDNFKEKIQNLRNKFFDAFKREPLLCVKAPGRVNLIGEHIDYNGGIVLPIAIERSIYLASAPRNENLYRLKSFQMEQTYEGELPLKPLENPFWVNYIFGVVNEFVKQRYSVPGFDALFDSDIPIASGLSSSAAIEVATTYFLHKLLPTKHSKLELALLCQRAENNFVGMKCGLMDQAVSICGEKGKALKLDCSIPAYENISIGFTDEARFLIAHSGVYRGLSSSEYNLRRLQCEEALRVINKKTGFGYKNLCEVPFDVFQDLKEDLPEVLFKLARHCIAEQQRVLQSIEALGKSDKEEFGKLLNESHKSLAEDYNVSCPELDDLTNWLRKQRGVYGSRLTGAGFGGCTISLVELNYADSVLNNLISEYYSKRGIKPLAFFSNAENGVSVI